MPNHTPRIATAVSISPASKAEPASLSSARPKSSSLTTGVCTGSVKFRVSSVITSVGV
jgi:hypothetical protein